VARSIARKRCAIRKPVATPTFSEFRAIAIRKIEQRLETRPTSGLLDAAIAATDSIPEETINSRLGKPTIIVSAPRSGSNLLFELLSRQQGIWTIGGESHAVFNAFPHLRAENGQMDSGCLGASHADADTRRMMRKVFLYLLRDHQQRTLLPLRSTGIRGPLNYVEKTPRNALNVPFLLEVFPDARFVFLHREPKACIASVVEAWTLGLQTGRFVTFKTLPHWDRPGWCFLLPPGWRRMIGRTLIEIAAFQWEASNRIVLDELNSLSGDRWKAVSYEALLNDPAAVLADLCRFIDPEIQPAPIHGGTLPLSRTTLSPPHPDKWKKHQTAIEALLPSLDSTVRRLTALRNQTQDAR
jgi:hypothetical protein